MKIITGLTQGSTAWHAHRATKWNASDAPAMVGESPHCTRAELLQRMATGIAPEVDDATQRRFDKGHAVEKLLIAHACELIGEPLHPFVAVADFDERYSASFDGCTFVGDEIAESKLLNARLRAAFADMETIAPEHRERSAGQCLPIDYRLQMEQQLRIAGATRCLFLAGELREDGTLGDTLSCWYYPDDALWARIQAGWKQFAEDLANYVQPVRAEKLAAEPVEALPAVMVQVSGALTLTDNFDVFEKAMRAFLQDRLIREPQTDQDFADLDAQIKAMKGAEDALDRAEAQMLAQVSSVDAAKRRKDTLKKLVRDNRLLAEKLLATEKERRRGELVADGVAAIRAHVDGLNKRLGAALMPATVTAVDFGQVIKGMRSLAGMQDAIATRVAGAKIAANEVADKIDANLKTLAAVAPEHAALFPDRAAIVLKAPEDLESLVRARVAEHDAAVKRRAEEAAERERARIRAEEQEKLAREQREREAAERRQREDAEALERRQREAMERVHRDAEAGAAAVRAAGGATPPAVVPMLSRAPAANEKPTMRLGELNARIAPLTIDAAGLAALGFAPAATDKSAKLYHASQFPAMVDSIVAHLRMAQQKHLQAA
ncbi:YqaJ viral recombinase family protein [Ramlibacter sp.]|uniref:YqaJ viral recombinase family protein n=1 Tax=Ramlibacter sp. TaxID=1917967 RepID=UPI003D09B892